MCSRKIAEGAQKYIYIYIYIYIHPILYHTERLREQKGIIDHVKTGNGFPCIMIWLIILAHHSVNALMSTVSPQQPMGLLLLPGYHNAAFFAVNCLHISSGILLSHKNLIFFTMVCEAGECAANFCRVTERATITVGVTADSAVMPTIIIASSCAKY